MKKVVEREKNKNYYRVLQRPHLDMGVLDSTRPSHR